MNAMIPATAAPEKFDRLDRLQQAMLSADFHAAVVEVAGLSEIARTQNPAGLDFLLLQVIDELSASPVYLKKAATDLLALFDLTYELNQQSRRAEDRPPCRASLKRQTHIVFHLNLRRAFKGAEFIVKTGDADEAASMAPILLRGAAQIAKEDAGAALEADLLLLQRLDEKSEFYASAMEDWQKNFRACLADKGVNSAVLQAEKAIMRSPATHPFGRRVASDLMPLLDPEKPAAADVEMPIAVEACYQLAKAFYDVDASRYDQAKRFWSAHLDSAGHKDPASAAIAARDGALRAEKDHADWDFAEFAADHWSTYIKTAYRPGCDDVRDEYFAAARSAKPDGFFERKIGESFSVLLDSIAAASKIAAFTMATEMADIVSGSAIDSLLTTPLYKAAMIGLLDTIDAFAQQEPDRVYAKAKDVARYRDKDGAVQDRACLAMMQYSDRYGSDNPVGLVEDATYILVNEALQLPTREKAASVILRFADAAFAADQERAERLLQQGMEVENPALSASIKAKYDFLTGARNPPLPTRAQIEAFSAWLRAQRAPGG